MKDDPYGFAAESKARAEAVEYPLDWPYRSTKDLGALLFSQRVGVARRRAIRHIILWAAGAVYLFIGVASRSGLPLILLLFLPAISWSPILVSLFGYNRVYEKALVIRRPVHGAHPWGVELNIVPLSTIERDSITVLIKTKRDIAAAPEDDHRGGTIEPVVAFSGISRRMANPFVLAVDKRQGQLFAREQSLWHVRGVDPAALRDALVGAMERQVPTARKKLQARE